MTAENHPHSPLPGAIIFDLDGTLVDTAPDLAAALNHCLAEDGHAPFAVEEMRGLVGRGAAALLQRGYTRREGKEPDADRLNDLRVRFLDYYGAHIADNSKPFDGVVAAMDALLERGVKLGVCTNKPHDMAIVLLKHLNWIDTFGAIYGGDILGVKKPDPDHIFAVARDLDVAPEDCVFIGDSEVDYAAAQAANMRMILVTFGYSNVPLSEMPKAVQLSHYDDLLDALKTL